MNRRELLGSALLSVSALGSTQAPSTEPATFPGTKFCNYPACLPNYLSTLAQEASRKREHALARLTSINEIHSRQQQVRATLWRLIGGPEQRTPLHPKTTGVLQRPSYRVEKLIYQSRPGLFVAANLYIPKRGHGPFPAVLFQSGHYWEGKAYPSYQRCCQGLAQLGFVVLAFDPMGQGERIHYLDRSGTKSRLPSCDAEHTMPGKQMLLFGDSATRFQLWDAIRGLDHLLSLPFVDPKRVASVGHSGGATLTMLLAAADDRLSAAAVCMGNAENIVGSPFRSPGATDDAEQDFVDCAPAAFDRWDLFYPFAPKPMLIWPSDRDFFATYSPDYITNGWQEYLRLQNIYRTLGRSDSLAWSDTPLPHALAYDSRMLVYNWFRRWLQNETRPLPAEPPVDPEPPATLWATPSGSVVRDLHSVTPFSLIKARTIQHDSTPLESLLKSRPQNHARAASIGRVQCRNVLVDVLEIPSDPAIWLPAYLLLQDHVSKTKPLLLVLDENENTRLWFTPEVDRILPDNSPVIVAADLRGVGALLPQFSPGAADYEAWHQQEENYAWGSLALGRPLLAQRTSDILALTAALRAYPSTAGRTLYLAARGKLTVPALFAASLDPAIERLYLAAGLVSFQNLVETEVYAYPFANFLPGLLNHTDLPAIAASLAPRKITLAGVVDATGKTLPVESVRAIYRTSGQTSHLSLQPHANWSVDSLLAFTERTS